MNSTALHPLRYESSKVETPFARSPIGFYACINNHAIKSRTIALKPTPTGGLQRLPGRDRPLPACS